MDAQKVSAAIAQIAADHHATLSFLGNRQTQLLEIGASVAVMQHYRSKGYKISIVNPNGSHEFKVKLGTRGHPANYSHVVCERESTACEIHSNLSVEGARDRGVYCVDVAVVNAGAVPKVNDKKKVKPVLNKDLVSFSEAKKLVVYPMLLAHFIGIVHEVTPRFMRKTKLDANGNDHLVPALITLGHLTKNAQTILKSFERRRYKIVVAESFDQRLFLARGNPTVSPFSPLSELRKDDSPSKGESEEDEEPVWKTTQYDDDELDELVPVVPSIAVPDDDN